MQAAASLQPGIRRGGLYLSVATRGRLIFWSDRATDTSIPVASGLWLTVARRCSAGSENRRGAAYAYPTLAEFTASIALALAAW